MGKPRRSSKTGSNNFQDKFAEKEFDKGLKQGRRNSVKRGGNGGTVSIFTGSSDNDASWYIPNNQMAKDYASLPFGIATGLPLDPQWLDPIENAPKWQIPGIMTFKVMPTIGNASETTDPINVSSAALFAFVRHATSGTSYYEAPDLTLYVLAAANLYSFYGMLTRIYGICSNYSVLNRYTPEALVNAMGVDFPSIQSHLSDFRAFINLFAYKLQQIYVPLNIKYIARLIFLYENIYMDSSNSKAQYYMYVPDGFWQYQEGVGDEAAGQLNYKPFSVTKGILTTVLEFEDLIEYGNSLLEPIIGSQDCLYISADMLKAFGTSGNFKVSPIAENFTVTPVYNQEVLMQMENAFIHDVSVSDTTTIKQDVAINSSCLVSNYVFQNTNVYQDKIISDRYLVNMHHDNPTPEEVIVASQFAGVSGKKTSASGPFVIEHMGATIITKAYMYYFAGSPAVINSTPIASIDTIFLNGDATVSNTVIEYQNQLQKAALLSKFDWHPAVRFFTAMATTPTGAPFNFYMSDIMMDLDNFTPVDVSILDNINTMSLLGLFPGKDLGSFSMK